MLYSSVLLPLVALSSASPLFIRHSSLGAAGWNADTLEPYDVYHARYAALGCQSKQSQLFYHHCCRPLLANQHISSRPVECNPDANARRQAPTGYGDHSSSVLASITSVPPSVASTEIATSAPSPVNPTIDYTEDCDEQDDDEIIPTLSPSPYYPAPQYTPVAPPTQMLPTGVIYSYDEAGTTSTLPPTLYFPSVAYPVPAEPTQVPTHDGDDAGYDRAELPAPIYVSPNPVYTATLPTPAAPPPTTSAESTIPNVDAPSVVVSPPVAPTTTPVETPISDDDDDEDLPFCDELEGDDEEGEVSSPISPAPPPSTMIASPTEAASSTAAITPSTSFSTTEDTFTSSTQTTVEPVFTTPPPMPTPTPSTTTEEDRPMPTPDADLVTGGLATYYFQNGIAGACGTVHQDTDLIAAIDSRRYGNTSQRSPLCGQRVRITNPENQRSVEVTIQDACPSCENANSIDLSYAAFQALDNPDKGLIRIQWKFI